MAGSEAACSGFVLTALLGWKEARVHRGGWCGAGLLGMLFPFSFTKDTKEKTFAVAAFESAAFEVLSFFCKG